MDQYIQQALAGDEMAIEHLTMMHKPRLLAKAYTYMKNKQDAEDIVQETFIKAFGALAQLKEPKYFATWLYKILIRESFYAMKKKERTKLLEVEMCMDEAREEFNWRPKGWQDSDGKSYEHYMKGKFENRIKAKVDKRTKRLDSFIRFAEIEGEAKFSEEECLHIAAQFIQSYYPEYIPYLQVEVKDEEDIEENRAFFRFVVQKDGLFVENEFFHMNISKKTGEILMFLTPNVTVECIENFAPQAIKPINEWLPLKGLKVQMEWDKVYGKTEQDKDEMRLIYRIQMTDSAYIKGVNAESGEVIYSVM